MPGIDGYEVAATLKQSPSFEHTKIVAVTASAMSDDLKKIASAGFDGYLRKPLDPETFVLEIRRYSTPAPQSAPEPTGM